MVELIAKKYVKALQSVCDAGELEDVFTTLSKISENFTDSKFKDVMSSPEVGTSEKTAIILDAISSSTEKTKNLIKVLGENKRLDIIPEIAQELSYQIALTKNEFVGKIYSSKKLTVQQIKQLQTNFSKKLDSKIVLEQGDSDFDGVKVEIDDLGVEIGFSKERLQSQMLEHILKAI